MSLKEAIGRTNESLQYVPWESQIAFMDADGVTIYQTGFDDESFIVKHKNDYYIDEARYSEVAKSADSTLEQRNRTYHLGDPIELRKNTTENYIFKVAAAKSETVDGAQICAFRFVVNPEATPEQQRLFFDHVRTESGKVLKDFTFPGGGTVQIRLPAGDPVRTLVVKSPEYESATRTVTIEG